jgi:hypothetical protein
MRSAAAFLIPSAVLIAIVLLAQNAKAAINADQEIDRAVIFALADRNNEAVQTLKSVETQKITSEAKSRVSMTLGRIYYQAGKFAESAEQYDKVGKDSPYWLKSLEEKAWAQYQLKNTGKSLAILKTLTNPVFADEVSPEVYFLQSLNQLKTCDYPGVFKTIEQFKKVSKAPLAEAEQKANAGDSQAKAKVDEYSQTISKLQLAEVEAIQYVYTTEPGKRPTISKVSKNSNQLSFPESEEVWLDEIDAYQVQAKGCPTAQGVM